MKQEFKTKNSNHLIRSKNYNKRVWADFIPAHNKGITLIALIITIIILLILSVVTITSISNSNILKHAQDAKENYSIAEEKERVTLAVHQGILEGEGTINKAGVTSGMNSQFPNNGWEETNWNESEEYVRVLIKASKRQYKISLDTGKVEYEKYPGLKIGDKVNYTVRGYTGEWRVLDIGENNVKLLATSNVETLRIDGDDTTLGVWDETTKSYKNAENKLDEVCEKYINETYATEAKSIKVEDIDKITGYNKNGTAIGEKCQYNDKVTFIIENEKVKYKVNSGNFIELGKGFATLKAPQAQEKIQGEYIVINTSYSYKGDGFVEEGKPFVTKLNDTSSNTYKMLFGDNDQDYWLASSFVSVHINDSVDNYMNWCTFGLKTVNQGYVSDMQGVLWFASNENNGYSCESGVRPVITLKSDIKLTQTSENSGEWNISK